MRRVTRWSMLLSAGLMLAITASAARAEDKKSDEKALNRQGVDRAIYANLKEVIDRGALLFNNDGDWNGCYHLYEGALMSVRPLLSDRAIQSWVKEDREGLVEALVSLKSSLGEQPRLKDVIETAITNARQTPEVRRRAFVVRVALDQVRAETKPAGAGKPNDTSKAGKTLWDRLGGEAGVTKIVDDFANAVVADPKVDFFRNGKFKPEADEITKMKREIVEQVSQATGGPLKYTGPDMKKIHKDMGITGQQFDAAVGHLKNALQKNNVAEKDVATVLSAVKATRSEIVAPKKPVETKPEDKKPEENKPADKKPGTKTSISGKVTYKGKPLSGGAIIFEGADGRVVTATIDADGTYKLDKIKPNVAYKLAITTEAVKRNPPGGKPAISPKGAPELIVIPEKYSDADKSGLTFTPQEGNQNHDIALE